MDKTIKTVVFWAVMVVSAFLLFQVVKSSPPEQASREISYSQFMSVVDSSDVAKVTIMGSRIRGQYRSSGGAFWLVGPTNQALFLDALHQKGAEIWFKDAGGERYRYSFLALGLLFCCSGHCGFSWFDRCGRGVWHGSVRVREVTIILGRALSGSGAPSADPESWPQALKRENFQRLTARLKVVPSQIVARLKAVLGYVT